MKTKLCVLILLIILLVGGAQIASAQTPPPTIIAFASSLDEIRLTEAETGSETVTLSWRTVGVAAEHRLTLSTYRQNRWSLVFDEASVPLEANGSRTVTVEHPLNFGPPTYLLSIVDAQSRILDQRVLIIPYAEETEEPAVDTFTADLTSVDVNALAGATARVTVSWQVENRPPESNLVFEQVFADDSAVSVELSRPTLWVPSVGSGPVAPIWRQGEEAVRLRVRVIDLVTDEVLAEEELSLDITGTLTVIPATPVPTMQPAAQPIGVPGGNEIVTFTAAPTTVNPGAAVTLSWEVRGTGGVTVEQTVPNIMGSSTVVSAQSPKGTATVYLPDYALYSATFTLWSANRSDSASVEVQVHCPYTFFFGQGDGCPSTQPMEVQAAFQQFEGGVMIWRSDTGEIYVFYNDGAFQEGSAGYYMEAAYASMPDNLSNETPPLDRVAPVSGFGKVWANAPGVREKLGWGLGSEVPFTMTLQMVGNARTPAPEFAYYLTLPDGKVIGSGFGRWRVVQ